MKAKPPTDLELLSEIYYRYHEEYAAWSRENRSRQTKNLVPIDVEAVAEALGVEGDIVFGQLYYHLQERYKYRQPDGSIKTLFAKDAGQEKHCINFPMAASVLAGLAEDHKRYWITTWLSAAAVIIALLSLTITLLHPHWGSATPTIGETEQVSTPPQE